MPHIVRHDRLRPSVHHSLEHDLVVGVRDLGRQRKWTSTGSAALANAAVQLAMSFSSMSVTNRFSGRFSTSSHSRKRAVVTSGTRWPAATNSSRRLLAPSLLLSPASITEESRTARGGSKVASYMMSLALIHISGLESSRLAARRETHPKVISSLMDNYPSTQAASVPYPHLAAQTIDRAVSAGGHS